MASEPRTSRGELGPPLSPLQARPDESPITPYVRALKAHWLIGVLVFIATLGAAAAYLSVRTPDYSADAEFLVKPIAEENETLFTLPLVRDSGDPTRTIQTAAELIDSHDAADRAARKLGGNWTRTKVQSTIQVDPQGQTDIVEITATATSGAEAARIANAFAESVVETRVAALTPPARALLEQVQGRIDAIQDPAQASDLEDIRSQLNAIVQGKRDPSITLNQLAVAPDDPLGLPASFVLALALVAGLVLATGSALAIEIITPDRISSEEELVRVWGVPILARIPKLPRSRARPTPGTLDMDPLVREAFRTVQVQLERTGTRRRAILVGSASRGDGKTTSAASFALELAESGALVIAVDADLRKPDLGRALGVVDGTLEDRVDRPQIDTGDGEPLRQDPLKPVPGQPSMWLLDLKEIVELEGADRYTRRMRGLITGMLNAVDYVVVDTPPMGEVSDALTLVDEVDHVIMVSRIGNTRRLSAEVARDLLDRAGVEPTGFVVIGGKRATSGRYPYGGA